MENEDRAETNRRWRRWGNRAISTPYVALAVVAIVALTIMFLLQPVYFPAVLLVIAGIVVLYVGKANPIALPAGILILVLAAILGFAAVLTGGVGLNIGGFHQAQGF